MKWLLLLFLVFWYLPHLHSQDIYEFAAIDKKISTIPSSDSYSSGDIAGFIQSNFKTDRDRIRAIYTWVATNIKYDVDSMYAINWSGGPAAKVTEALRRRKGVCENYAAIFNDIAIKIGLNSFVVDGYTKQGGAPDRTGHSWCAVCLHGEWLLCDPTWDKDANGNTNYFLISPAGFIESHMPFDPMWQLLNYPLSYREFNEGYSSKKDKSFFNFPDSIKAFTQLSELEQLQATSTRMLAAGQASKLLKNRIDYTKMRIGLIYEDKDKNLYDGAVADLNNAAAAFNELVQYRNNRFIPAKTAIQIHTLTDVVTTDISSAYKKINNMSIYNAQYDPAELKSRLDNLVIKLQQQKDFFKKYLAADEAEKMQLF
ncbi:MAG: transglutaminase domain-containing protein [Ferruginibacter sp.]